MNKTFNDLIGEAVKECVQALIDEFDKKREPVADAARELYVDRGYGMPELIDSGHKSITDTARLQRLFNPILRKEAIGEHGEGVRAFQVDEPNFKMYTDSWPLRKLTADSAEYLFRLGLWSVAALAPSCIRSQAARQQEMNCSQHANAAEFVWQIGSRIADWIQMASYEEITREAQRVAGSRKEIKAIITAAHIEGSARFEFIDAHGHLIKTETISGKSTTPYKRYVTLDRDYDHYEVHVSGVASVRVVRA